MCVCVFLCVCVPACMRACNVCVRVCGCVIREGRVILYSSLICRSGPKDAGVEGNMCLHAACEKMAMYLQ